MRKLAAFLCPLFLVSAAGATPPKAKVEKPAPSAAAAPAKGHRAVPSRRARSVDPTTAQFLGHDPIGPLAAVAAGKVRQPERGACRSWGKIGSLWNELDAYGAVAGQVVVTNEDYYDVSRCNELSVRRLQGRAGAGVYVASQTRYASPPFERYSLTNRQKTRLHKAVDAAQSAIGLIDPEARVVFTELVLSFAQKGTPKPSRWAVVGGRSLVVLREDHGSWVVEHQDKPRNNKALGRAYKPLMITDMNGDGQPEIVYHALENFGEFYGDLTLSRSADGTWTLVKPGIFGSSS